MNNATRQTKKRPRLRARGRMVTRWVRRLERFTDRWWYVPLLALLAGLDIFILVVPTDALLISAVLQRPRKWISRFVWISCGSALGALWMALAIAAMGSGFADRYAGGAIGSEHWIKTARFVQEHGALSVAVFAGGPFPLQPGVIIAALAGLPSLQIFVWTWVGRCVKYGVFAWVASHAPGFLARFKKGKQVIEAERREGPA